MTLASTQSDRAIFFPSHYIACLKLPIHYFLGGFVKPDNLIYLGQLALRVWIPDALDYYYSMLQIWQVNFILVNPLI